MNPTDKITDTFRLTQKQKDALKKLKLETLEDLLLHVPSRYEDVQSAPSISQIQTNTTVTVYGKIHDVKKTLSWRTKKYVIEAKLSDETATVKLRFFNQVYVEKMLAGEPFAKVTGKLMGKTNKYFANPQFEILPHFTRDSNATLVRIYPESKGITSRWFSVKTDILISQGLHKKIKDPIPKEIIEKYNLPTLSQAILLAHKPRSLKEAEVSQKRFSFDSVFFIQLQKQLQKLNIQSKKTYKINTDSINDFLKLLPFKLTVAQQKAIEDTVSDLQKNQPLSRLIEGDVGSGKTAVAAAVAFATVATTPPEQKAGTLQVAYMTPTEILARQQYQEFISLFKNAIPYKFIRVALLTSSGARVFPSKTNPQEDTKISKTQLIKWVKDGTVAIVVGTHSLIQKNVSFKHLALAIIDEQHRFGIAQRAALAKKDNKIPHLISMTATPIPRTLALTIYGDLDLSIIDKMPPGRKKVITKIATEKQRGDVYKFVEKELKKGRQAYVICPRVQEPDPEKALALRVASAEKEFEKIQKAFPKYKIGLLHGKMNTKEKDEVMSKFVSGEIDILVATTVVEVGVNVKNASVMIIEGAERFGLAQLHQLRGRIKRGAHQPYCFLFTTSSQDINKKRLKIFESTDDGFKLAEYDLKLRGPGELTGSSQWGLSDLAMKALQNLKMVSAAREAALELIRTGKIQNYPELLSKIEKTDLHFE